MIVKCDYMFSGGELLHLYGVQKVLPSKLFRVRFSFCNVISKIRANTRFSFSIVLHLHSYFLQGFRPNTMAFASRNSVRKSRRDDVQPPKSEADNTTTNVQVDSMVSSFENSAAQNSSTIPSRSTVLQACTVTSGLIAALGIIIRQVVLLSCVTTFVLCYAFVPELFPWNLGCYLVITHILSALF